MKLKKITRRKTSLLPIHLFGIIFLNIFLFCYSFPLADEIEEEPFEVEPFEVEPYVTLLTTKYQSGEIRISFEPLKDENIRYRVYRSQNIIMDEKALSNAVMVCEITNQGIPYLDAPETDGKYYYSITLLENGKEYKTFIPFQNINVNPIDYSPFPEMVQNIDIKAKTDDQIDLYFTPAHHDYTYTLYTSSSEISEITEQEPFTTLKGSTDRFSVPVKKDTPYYFVITVANRFGVENNDITPGKNENSEPYMIKSVEKVEEKKIVMEEKEIVRPRKKITNEELIRNNLSNNFYRGNYQKALDTFLPILGKSDITVTEMAMAHFYTGQCYFYLGNYKNAVKYFILSKELQQFKNRSEIWIDRCLERIDG